MLTPTRLLLHDLLVAAKAGPLNAVFMGLCVGPTPAFTTLSVMGGVTEPGWTGYARVAVVWGANYIDQDGAEAFDSQAIPFGPTDNVLGGGIVTGAFLATLITAGALLAGVLFDEPCTLADDQALITVLARFTIPQGASSGDVVFLC